MFLGFPSYGGGVRVRVICERRREEKKRKDRKEGRKEGEEEEQRGV